MITTLAIIVSSLALLLSLLSIYYTSKAKKYRELTERYLREVEE